MAKRQYRIRRLIAQVPFTENGFYSQDLPRGYDIEHVGVRFNGTINITTLVAAGYRAEAPVQLLKRIEIIADGKNTIASVRGDVMNRSQAAFRKGQNGTLTPPSATGVAAYPNVNASLVIDQNIPDGVRPKDSNLRTSGMQLLQIKFTFGQVSDMFKPGAGAGNATVSFVDIWTSELVEIADPNDKSVTTPLYLRKRSYQDIAVVTSNAALDVQLPIGNVMRGVVLRAEGLTTAGEPDDTVLQNVILRSLTDVRLNMPYLDLREQNKFDYAVTTLPTGICIADIMCSGQESGVRATEGWDLTRASEAKLTLNVTGGANVKVSAMVEELLG